MISGDARVDRRFDYARDYAAQGDYAAALDIIAQCLELTPQWPPLHFYAGEYYQAQGNKSAAIEAYKNCLRLDAGDQLGASLRLTLLGAIEPPDHFREGYVRALFDQYAARFDNSLVKALRYTVPERLFTLINETRPMTGAQERILDLGCGTGLAGNYFKKRAAFLEGVDLSPGMISQAAGKKIYHRLEAADITAFLQTPPALPYDLILAADVFVYVGALDTLFPLIAQTLSPGGLFGFSVQETEGQHYLLGSDHRFAHSRAYVERLLAESGLIIRHMSREALRQDGPSPITGYIVVAEKPETLGTGLAMPQNKMAMALKT